MKASTRLIGITTWRISKDRAVSRRTGSRGPWETVTQGELRALPLMSPEWGWLYSQGIRRSGGLTLPESERPARQVMLRLEARDAARLDALADARGMTRSALVASLVEAAWDAGIAAEV